MSSSGDFNIGVSSGSLANDHRGVSALWRRVISPGSLDTSDSVMERQAFVKGALLESCVFLETLNFVHGRT